MLHSDQVRKRSSNNVRRRGVLQSCLSPNSVSEPTWLTMYIPDRDESGNKVNVAYWIAATCQLLAHRFGGATVSPAYTGYWHNPGSGQLVKERTFTVSCCIDNADFHEHAAALERHIKRFGRTTNQGEVMITIGASVLRYTNFD